MRSISRSEALAKDGGGGGIRTHDPCKRIAVFKTAWDNHSLPLQNPRAPTRIRTWINDLRGHYSAVELWGPVPSAGVEPAIFCSEDRNVVQLHHEGSIEKKSILLYD